MILNTFMIKLFTPIIDFFSFLKNILWNTVDACVLISLFVRTKTKEVFISTNFISKGFFNNEMIAKSFQNRDDFATSPLINISNFPVRLNLLFSKNITATKKVFDFFKDKFVSIGNVKDGVISGIFIFSRSIGSANRDIALSVNETSDILNGNHMDNYIIKYNNTKGGVKL